MEHGYGNISRNKEVSPVTAGRFRAFDVFGLFIMGLLIAYLLGLFTAVQSKEHSRANIEKPTDTSHCKTLPDGPIPIAYVPSTLSDEERAKKKKTASRKTITFWVNIATLIVLAIYTGITLLVWCANHKAANAAESAANTSAQQMALYRQQIEGVEAAIVNYRMRIENGTIYIDVGNFGHVISKKATVNLDIFRQKYSGTIDTPSITHLEKEFIQYEPIPQESREGDPLSALPGHQLKVMDIPPSDAAAINYVEPKYTFVIRGTIVYDDGFGETITKPICKVVAYRPSFLLTGQPAGGDEAPIECSDYRAWVDNMKKEVIRRTKPK